MSSQPVASASIPATVTPYNQLPPIVTQLFQQKARKGLTFADIGKAVNNRDEVWIASLMHAQAKGTDEELELLGKVLGIDPEVIKSQIGAHWYPQRSIGPIPPTDPVLYRLFEGVMVYGQPIKAIIHEKFGDGIMSMIDCNVKVDKKDNRVQLVFDGKFLSYSKW